MGVQERKQREKSLRREAIIDAAEVVFFKSGFEEATIDDIAQEAELAKGTIYLYFKSKEEIFAQIVVRAVNKLYEIVEKNMTTSHTGYENFQGMCESFEQFLKKHSNYLKAINYYHSNLLHELADSKEIITQLEEKKLLITTQLIKIIEKGQSDGSIDPTVDAKKIALIIMYSTGTFINPSQHKIQKLEKELGLAFSCHELMHFYFQLIAKALRNSD